LRPCATTLSGTRSSYTTDLENLEQIAPKTTRADDKPLITNEM
jgi:hypothetical protein